ncbi:SLBB domain-containing protein [Roseofilum casamattae]|uniref:SLBB domain-containing protein n=1 Tax=Roseofilum casamattae BLCC-M143 TaxID=3022442 RepID=A0ABT7C046_9CYAN|nr:SLBB domain-containing protein [Roseofilum casamattae]MDJ1184825.1 SLBB domain-containing protein [Roseofilum casamattae BLCC-M143]
MKTYLKPFRCSRPLLALAIAWELGIGLISPAIAQPTPTESNGLNSNSFEEQSTPASPENPASADNAYVLVGGDRIQIDVLELPEYSGNYQIPVDGLTELPLIGSIPLAGLTLAQAREILSEAYSGVLRYPAISIRLVSPSPINIVIAGEVTNPGTFTVRLIGGAGNVPGIQYPTLTEVLKQAGGVTLAANISNIQITRTVWQERQQRTISLNVNLQDLVQTNRSGRDITIRSGDKIFVPTQLQPNLQQLWQLARVDFFADRQSRQSVVVVGEVQHPGAYHVTLAIAGSPVTSLPTVSSAIRDAGGIKPTADLRNITLRRQTQTGSELIIPLDFWELLHNGDITQDTIIQTGDSIIIPRAAEVSNAEATELAGVNFAPDSITVSVVGEVRSPGSLNVPPSTPLNQVLLRAGGFNRARAKTRQVQLLRLNSNGTVASRQIKVDLDRDIDEQINPLLQNNDIIFVSRSGIARFSDTLNVALSPANSLFSLWSIPLRTLEVLSDLGIIPSGSN